MQKRFNIAFVKFGSYFIVPIHRQINAIQMCICVQVEISKPQTIRDFKFIRIHVDFQAIAFSCGLHFAMLNSVAKQIYSIGTSI